MQIRNTGHDSCAVLPPHQVRYGLKQICVFDIGFQNGFN